jgi:hypothetical protein
MILESREDKICQQMASTIKALFLLDETPLAEDVLVAACTGNPGVTARAR